MRGLVGLVFADSGSFFADDAAAGTPVFMSDGFFNPPAALAVDGLSARPLPFATDTLYFAPNAVGLFNPVPAFDSSFSLLAIDVPGLALTSGLRAALLFEVLESALFFSATAGNFIAGSLTLRAVLAVEATAGAFVVLVLCLGSILGALEGTTDARP